MVQFSVEELMHQARLQFGGGGGGGAALLVPRDSGTNTTVDRDPNQTSTDMMVTDASISN